MKVLIVGGAGNVASIIRPALEAKHDLTVFDRVAVESLGDRSIVADVNDNAAARAAVAGKDAIVYMAMGVGPQKKLPNFDLDAAFDVNLRGHFRFLRAGLEAGVMRYVYASSLSVYANLSKMPRIDESIPPTAWHPYGMSKRLAERLCEITAQIEPRATIVALRLSMPQTREQKRRHQPRTQLQDHDYTLPHDASSLFLAALACPHTGAHIVQATGDAEGIKYPNDRVARLLGWRPIGS